MMSLHNNPTPPGHQPSGPSTPLCSSIPTINILSYNINSSSRAGDIINCMAKHNIHIMTLQDCKITGSNKLGFMKQLTPHTLIATPQDTSSMPSVSLIISDKISKYITNKHQSKGGRHASVELSFPGCKVAVITFYGRTQNGATVAMVSTPIHQLIQVVRHYVAKQCHIIVTGDFNIKLDKQDPMKKFLNLFMSLLNLRDVFRTLHPGENGFTYTNSRKMSSRIDYCFCSPSLLPYLDCEVKSFAEIHNPFDHTPLLCPFNYSDMSSFSINQYSLPAKSYILPISDREEYNRNVSAALTDNEYSTLTEALRISSIKSSKQQRQSKATCIKHKLREQLSSAHTEIESLSTLKRSLPEWLVRKIASIALSCRDLPLLAKHSSLANRHWWLTRSATIIKRLKHEERELRYNYRKSQAKKFRDRQDTLLDEGNAKAILNHILERKQVPLTIIKDKGAIITDPVAILEAQRSFAENLAKSRVSRSDDTIQRYESTYPSPTATCDFGYLTEPISISEIRTGCNNMADSKAPGIDELTSVHFKQLDDSNLSKLQDMYNSWLSEGKVPQGVKESLRICIPKGKSDVRLLENQRPISLTPMASRIFSHILAKRLGGSLQQVLCPVQTAFLAGRSVEEHTHTLRSILEDSKQFKKPVYGALLDLVKAYDSVEHWAIEAALRRLRLPDKFIALVMDTHTDATAYISSAWGKSDPFKLERGVLQGDPLACLIFIIFIDPLIALIHKDSESNGIEMASFPAAADPKVLSKLHISVLAYADDLLLVAPDVSGLNVMLQHCKVFFDLVGSTLSTTKTVLFSTVESSTSEFCMYGATKLKFIGTSTPFRYLGILFTAGLSWVAHLASLRSKANHVMMLMSRKYLSTNQALLAINSHLIAVLLYGLAIGCASKNDIKALQRVINRCARSSCGIPNAVNNEALYSHITEGGLGIYKLQDRLDSKLLHDTEVRLCSTTTVGLATRSRLAALQYRWGTVENPLVASPGNVFKHEAQAASNHFLALIRRIMLKYNLTMRIVWPPRVYGRGPPIRSILPAVKYENLLWLKREMWDKGLLYVGDVCDNNGATVLSQDELRIKCGNTVAKRNLPLRRWYKILLLYLCGDISCRSLSDNIRKRVPRKQPTLLNMFAQPRIVRAAPSNLSYASASPVLPSDQHITMSQQLHWDDTTPVIHIGASHYADIQQRSKNMMRSGFSWCIAVSNHSLDEDGLPDDQGLAYGRVPGIQSCFKADLFAIAHVLSVAPRDKNIIICSPSESIIHICSRDKPWSSIRHQLSSYLHCLIQSIFDIRCSRSGRTEFRCVKKNDPEIIPYRKLVRKYAALGSVMMWSQESPKILHRSCPVIWADASSNQPVEYSIKLDIKGKTDMTNRLLRKDHHRQGVVFRRVVSSDTYGHADRTNSDIMCATAPRPCKPSALTMKSLPRNDVKWSSSESRSIHVFIIRLVHSQLPTRYWLNKVMPALYTQTSCKYCGQPDTVNHIFHRKKHCAAYTHLHRDLHSKLQLLIKDYNTKSTSKITVKHLTSPFLTSLIPSWISTVSIELASRLHKAILSTIAELWEVHNNLG